MNNRKNMKVHDWFSKRSCEFQVFRMNIEFYETENKTFVGVNKQLIKMQLESMDTIYMYSLS